MEEDDDRTVELSSVEAIFPELVRHGSYSVSLEIPVPLSKSVRVVFPATQQVAPAPASLHDTLSFQQPVNDAAAEPEIIHLFNLPPLNATIKLPEGYPSEKPPHVQLTPQEAWLPQAKLDELRDASVQLWEDMGRDMVVYSYIEHMQEAAENCFDLAIDGTLDIPPQLKVALLDFDCKVKKEKFDKETFECGICLEPKKGLACYRLLNCGHVFCVACLQDFYNSCITEGDVDGVKCMDPSCGKEPPQTRDGAKRTRKPKKLQPSELLQIPISEEQVQRYVKIRRKRKLERNPNTIYCPRKWCQGPARAGNATSSDGESSDSDDENENPGGPEPEHIVAAAEEPDSVEETEDGEDEEPVPQRAVPGERLAVCTDCGFAFCMVCAKTWHGEFGRCSTRLAEELSKEEKASAEYMRKHSTPCPTCNVRSQKSLGCNHMKCRQCNTHFCYLCASWLNKDNPYEHFNTEGTPCYQLLWELEEGDGAGAPARPEPVAIEVIFEEDPPAANPAPRNVPAVVPPPAPAPPQPGARPVPWQGQRRGQRRGEQGIVAAQPGDRGGVGLQGHGLQRFLELAARDEEDGWDSDEMDEIEEELVRIALEERRPRHR